MARVLETALAFGQEDRVAQMELAQEHRELAVGLDSQREQHLARATGMERGMGTGRGSALAEREELASVPFQRMEVVQWPASALVRYFQKATAVG
mmetsp:Transcript_3820/g.13610  ORF Transcript_3820/g.13610 Transcript_3820/m.13610 type:complete len:95 (+) Transcript_3820:166-450(+)